MRRALDPDNDFSPFRCPVPTIVSFDQFIQSLRRIESIASTPGRDLDLKQGSNMWTAAIYRRFFDNNASALDAFRVNALLQNCQKRR